MTKTYDKLMTELATSAKPIHELDNPAQTVKGAYKIVKPGGNVLEFFINAVKNIKKRLKKNA